MPRSSPSAVLLGLLGLLAWGHDVAAQRASIRFTARPGTQVRTISGSRGTITFREVSPSGQPVGDSIVGEMTSLGGITRRVLDERNGNRMVEVQYDSLRTRQRLAGQQWKESALSQADKIVLSLTLDERLRPVQGGGGGLQADPVANTGIGSWRGVEMPDFEVKPGDSWFVNTVFRLPSQLGALLELSIGDSIVSTASVKLDSVVALPADTFMYLSVQQTLGPVMLPAVDAGQNAVIQLAGSQASSLVWSTAWNAYVSGASQARVVGRLTTTGATGSARAAQITWFLTTRLQLRM